MSGGSHSSSAILPDAINIFKMGSSLRSATADSDALGDALVTSGLPVLLQNKSEEQVRPSRNPARAGTWQHILSPEGFTVHPQRGSSPRWLLQGLIPCPVQVRLANAGGFQELVFLTLWYAGSILEWV